MSNTIFRLIIIVLMAGILGLLLFKPLPSNASAQTKMQECLRTGSVSIDGQVVVCSTLDDV